MEIYLAPTASSGPLHLLIDSAVIKLVPRQVLWDRYSQANLNWLGYISDYFDQALRENTRLKELMQFPGPSQFNGFVPPDAEVEIPEIGDAHFTAFLLQPTEFPLHPRQFSGSLQELAVHFHRSSSMCNPTGAVCVALAPVGHVLAGNVHMDGMSTNTYITILGRSGTGKSAMVREPKLVLEEVDLDGQIGPEKFTSGNAVLSTMRQI